MAFVACEGSLAGQPEEALYNIMMERVNLMT